MSDRLWKSKCPQCNGDGYLYMNINRTWLEVPCMTCHGNGVLLGDANGQHVAITVSNGTGCSNE